MATEVEIREQLVNCLAGELDLDAFDEWLTEATWNIHQSGDEAAQRLAYAIELRLFERSSGHLSDDDLDAELAALVGRYRATVEAGAGPTPTVETAATATKHPASAAA